MRIGRWSGLVLLAACLSAGTARAQGTASDIIYSRQPVFRIPFQTDPGEHRIKQIQLHVSADQGRSWQAYATAAPDQPFFHFQAERDGTYWFAVRTVDAEGRTYPAPNEPLRPGLKVCVDTQPPAISLQNLPPRDGMVGVGWDIRDDNLDLSSLRLEYRLANGVQWQPLSLETATAVGHKFWVPNTNGTLEVKLRARDRADNWGEARTTVVPATGTSGPATPLPNPVTAPAAPSPAAVRMVNSKHINLEYDVQDVGPSGLSAIELWYTQDARSWQKYGELKDPPKSGAYRFEVNDEGVYGFTLVVRSGVGIGDRPPQVGDMPQVWVEVDLTKPVVQVLNVDVGRGPEAGNLTVSWRASDKNLGRQPITLSYAEDPAGPWTPIAANVENTGSYVWRMPAQGVPYRFLLRVEATDRAGNVGQAEWPRPVIVDLAVPKPLIKNVTPAAKAP
ncbi:MAG: hypothetical protein NZ700_17845 [Gemmataceae bacterium]|nr:hypothetical protein [Gemmataceae bacterium]MDW8264656.1 hypothetical protein [Gemmataceae bacterium]